MLFGKPANFVRFRMTRPTAHQPARDSPPASKYMASARQNRLKVLAPLSNIVEAFPGVLNKGKTKTARTMVRVFREELVMFTIIASSCCYGLWVRASPNYARMLHSYGTGTDRSCCLLPMICDCAPLGLIGKNTAKSKGDRRFRWTRAGSIFSS